jgi:hypothetical protein
MTVLQWIMVVPHAMGGEALIGGLSMVLGESNYGRWTGMGNFFLDSFSSVELRAIAADWTQVIDTWNGGGRRGIGAQIPIPGDAQRSFF